MMWSCIRFRKLHCRMEDFMFCSRTWRRFTCLLCRGTVMIMSVLLLGRLMPSLCDGYIFHHSISRLMA